MNFILVRKHCMNLQKTKGKIMFIVIGYAIGMSSGPKPDVKPYAGPTSPTKEGAIEAWKNMALTNGETPSEIEKSAERLLKLNTDTMISQYDGDEILIVVELTEA